MPGYLMGNAVGVLSEKDLANRGAHRSVCNKMLGPETGFDQPFFE